MKVCVSGHFAPSRHARKAAKAGQFDRQIFLPDGEHRQHSTNLPSSTARFDTAEFITTVTLDIAELGVPRPLCRHD